MTSSQAAEVHMLIGLSFCVSSTIFWHRTDTKAWSIEQERLLSRKCRSYDDYIECPQMLGRMLECSLTVTWFLYLWPGIWRRKAAHDMFPMRWQMALLPGKVERETHVTRKSRAWKTSGTVKARTTMPLSSIENICAKNGSTNFWQVVEGCAALRAIRVVFKDGKDPTSWLAHDSGQSQVLALTI